MGGWWWWLGGGEWVGGVGEGLGGCVILHVKISCGRLTDGHYHI